jgi:ech hydrogenase subunit D
MTEKEVQTIDEIEPGRLLGEADALRSAGWRLVQILCVSSPGGSELSYSFGHGLAMKSLRFRALPDDEVPSITSIYPAAFLYENEIRDLFGLRIERIAGDWLGKVYDVASVASGPAGGGGPFSKVTITGPRSEGGTI